MSVLTTIIESLGLLRVSAEGRNVLLWPVPPAPPLVRRWPPLVEGNLAHPSGDLGLDNALRPRVSAILGPGATVAGVAVTLTDIVETITNRTTNAAVPNAVQVTRSLLAYGATHLTNDPSGRLLVGFRMPLPLEVDEAAGTWVTNLGTLETLRTLAPADLPDWLHRPVGRLPLDDPDDLRQSVAEELGLLADLMTLAAPLAVGLMTNPYEVVVRLYEVFFRVHRDHPDQEPVLAVAVLDTLVQHQVDLLATTTGGAAALRRLWTALTSPAAAAAPQAGVLRSMRMVAKGLGLAAGAAADTWLTPRQSGPRTEARELTLPASASPRPTGSVSGNRESTNGQQVLVLGRQVCGGQLSSWLDTKTHITYAGPAMLGRLDTGAFVGSHPTEIGATPLDPAAMARVEVVAAIAPNEGFLDGARLLDKGMISTGLQQWTAHGNDEVTVLLEHFRGLSPDHYDLFFGLYGLFPRLWIKADLASTPTPAGSTVQAANPDADPTVAGDPSAVPADPRRHLPRWVTFERVLPGAPPQRMPLGTGQPRFGYFGGIAVSAKQHTFAPLWAGRLRLASLLSAEYRIAQLQTAMHRFDRIARDAGSFTVPDPPHPPVSHPVSELFTSQFGAALLLDAHINAPGNIVANIKTAIANTTGTAHDNGGLDPAWLVRLISKYQVGRQLGDKVKRDKFIVDQQTAGVLSADSGSFTGW